MGMVTYFPGNVLITGGAGFIGSNLVKYWRKAHPCDRIVVLDSLTYAGSKDNLEPLLSHRTIDFIEGSILNESLVEDIIRKYDIETIIHLAAESHVDRSIQDPSIFVETNICGTHALLKAALKVWGPGRKDVRFHQVSTDEVYGTLLEGSPSFTETTPYAPNSPYSASKAAADHLVRSYYKTFGLPVTLSSCSNNYGPSQHEEKLIPKTIRNLIEGLPATIYGDGNQIRDWVHVLDHVEGIHLTILYGRVGEMYNLGGNDERRNIDLVKRLVELIDPILKDKYPGAPLGSIVHTSDRAGHDRRYSVNTNKAKEELGYSPKITLSEGLADTVDWYLNHWGYL